MSNTAFLDVNLLDDDHRTQRPCSHCKDWGRTLTEQDRGVVLFVHCPKCGRPTWPNLGVNLPAGMAWAMAGSDSMRWQQEHERIEAGISDQLELAWREITVAREKGKG